MYITVCGVHKPSYQWVTRKGYTVQNGLYISGMTPNTVNITLIVKR